MTDEPWPIDRLVRGWWEFHELMQGDGGTRRRALHPEDPDGAEMKGASEAVDETIWAGGVAAVELVRALAHAAPDGESLDPVVGTMDSLVELHGTDLAGALSEAAAHDARFAKVLASTPVLDESLDEDAFCTLAPWMPLMEDRAIRRPARPRPKGRRWKERGTPGVSRWGDDA